MRSLIVRFIKEEDGMEMVEWALVATLFALAAIGAWTTLGGQISAALISVGNAVAN
jgi:pilus assembly protein Flp/PilA